MAISYHKLSRMEQLKWLAEHSEASASELDELPVQVTNSQVIENYLTDYHLPEGVAVNFEVNDKEYIVPMVTEEPSVIAAASNGAKLVKLAGGFSATTERLMFGQVLLKAAANPTEVLYQNTDKLLEIANTAYPSIVKRGGGAKKIRVRTLSEQYYSLDVYVDTQEAMGANMINTMMEAIQTWLTDRFDYQVEMAILSNLPDEAVTTVTTTIPVELLDAKVAQRIANASQLAQLDPHRAATHNKGIMNGIDAVVIASGNDWRAIESGAHAFAARNGQYQGLSTWEFNGQDLIGKIQLPLAIGTVGGSIKINPVAQLNLKLLKTKSAKELANVIGAVGLAQNLAALRALVSEGIQSGHMRLQAKSLLLAQGATPEEIPVALSQLLKAERIDSKHANDVIQKLRGK